VDELIFSNIAHLILLEIDYYTVQIRYIQQLLGVMLQVKGGQNLQREVIVTTRLPDFEKFVLLMNN
jgi:hypothetical protein